jgi:hypothetical protein
MLFLPINLLFAPIKCDFYHFDVELKINSSCDDNEEHLPQCPTANIVRICNLLTDHSSLTSNVLHLTPHTTEIIKRLKVLHSELNATGAKQAAEQLRFAETAFLVFMARLMETYEKDIAQLMKNTYDENYVAKLPIAIAEHFCDYLSTHKIPDLIKQALSDETFFNILHLQSIDTLTDLPPTKKTLAVILHNKETSTDNLYQLLQHFPGAIIFYGNQSGYFVAKATAHIEESSDLATKLINKDLNSAEINAIFPLSIRYDKDLKNMSSAAETCHITGKKRSRSSTPLKSGAVRRTDITQTNPTQSVAAADEEEGCISCGS